MKELISKLLEDGIYFGIIVVGIWAIGEYYEYIDWDEISINDILKVYKEKVFIKNSSKLIEKYGVLSVAKLAYKKGKSKEEKEEIISILKNNNYKDQQTEIQAYEYLKMIDFQDDLLKYMFKGSILIHNEIEPLKMQMLPSTYALDVTMMSQSMENLIIENIESQNAIKEEKKKVAKSLSTKDINSLSLIGVYDIGNNGIISITVFRFIYKTGAPGKNLFKARFYNNSGYHKAEEFICQIATLEGCEIKVNLPSARTIAKKSCIDQLFYIKVNPENSIHIKMRVEYITEGKNITETFSYIFPSIETI